MIKHVGKMKNNGARIAVVFRTLPGDPYSALVVGTNGLADAYHDALMSLIETEQTQQANELADILSVRRFPDGSNMLEWLHTRGHLKKVPTNGVLMTPSTKDIIPLDELNLLIADQRGVKLEELAIRDGNSQPEPKVANTHQEEVVIDTPVETTENTASKFELTPAEMRSRADALYKEAARLRKEADSLDPPKKKTKSVKEEA
jgi:hypothetical protein